MSDETEVKTVENEWEDILGSGQLLRKIVKTGENENDVKPKRHDRVTIRLVEKLSDGTVISNSESLSFFVGHSEVIGGVEICVQMMMKGEIDQLKVPARLAYGKKGRDPDIPSEADLLCEVELVEIELGHEPSDLSKDERMEMAEEKRLRGNHYYGREEYHQAVPVYQLALEYLNMSSLDDPILAKNISEAKVKMYNNLAATQLKLSAWDVAISSLRDCLRLEPENPKALFRLAKAEIGKGEYRPALESLRKALGSDPESTLITREIDRVKQLINAENKRDQQLYKKMLSGKPSKAKSWTFKEFLTSKIGLISGFTCATAIAIAAFYMRNAKS